MYIMFFVYYFRWWLILNTNYFSASNIDLLTLFNTESIFEPSDGRQVPRQLRMAGVKFTFNDLSFEGKGTSQISLETTSSSCNKRIGEIASRPVTQKVN